MPISQSDAQKLLDSLEKAKKKPEVILRDLYVHGIDGANFLYQVYFDGEHIYDFCKKQLRTLPVFQDCVIEQNSFEFRVYLASEYEKGYLNEPITKINAYLQTFVLPHGIIKMYQDALDNPLPEQPKEEELDVYWEVFKDFSPVKRPRVALQVFCQSQGNMFQRIRDFLYMWYVPTETVRNAYEREQNEVRNYNSFIMNEYQREKQEQERMKSIAPEKIRAAVKKEKEIMEYLTKLEFQQEKQTV